MKRTLILGVASLFSLQALAGWDLDKAGSSVHFVTTKAKDATEIHEFKGVTGSIDDKGVARVEIELASVETLIPIRNKRMRNLLFQTDLFPKAVISAKIPDSLLSMAAGEIKQQKLPMQVNLHGVSKDLDAEVIVTGLGKGKVMVASKAPVLVRAADFKLDGGIEALRKIASLSSIGNTVPVNFTLIYQDS